MESLIENYLGGRHTLMYMNMTLGMYHPCKGVAREAGNDVVCYCSQQLNPRDERASSQPSVIAFWDSRGLEVEL